jgi:type IV pilus assembly protein PilY1
MAEKIIYYTHGFDQSGYRNRTVTYAGVTNTWKLGDIVSSTPKVQSSVRLNTYHLSPPTGYNDTTYSKFISSFDYKTRGMVYAGANDGLLHAFKLGTLDVSVAGFKARLCQEKPDKLDGECDEDETDTYELGKEVWAYVPKNSLPYLKYTADPGYCHIFFVDFPVYIFDASINKPSDCTETDYWNCEKKVTFKEDGKWLNQENTSWKTILIGGMGLGGACRKQGASCSNCVTAPALDPQDSSKALGLSSYFALDVTNPYTPTLLWEFTAPDLGYATSGPAVLRIGDPDKNGRWFVVFASGPTGPIEQFEFKAKSDQNLKLFILDLKTGELLRTINTGIQTAFGGSLFNSAIDTDRWNANSPGFYQDNGLYMGYVKIASSCSGSSSSTQEACTNGEWNQGGVIRLLTKEDPNPDNWTWSKVIENIGPVTSSVTRIQDRPNKKLWLFFATGRYFYKADDLSNRRALYGVMEQLYTTTHTIDYSATASILTRANLQDQTLNPVAILPEGKKGWYIDMDQAGSNVGAERVITDPLAVPGGVVYFTSFAPSADICSMGGNTYLWAVNYSTGGAANTAQLTGKALLQVSTGAIEEIGLQEGEVQEAQQPFHERAQAGEVPGWRVGLEERSERHGQEGRIPHQDRFGHRRRLEGQVTGRRSRRGVAGSGRSSGGGRDSRGPRSNGDSGGGGSRRCGNTRSGRRNAGRSNGSRDGCCREG